MENLFILILFLALALLFFSIVSSKNRELKEYKFRTIMYLLLTGILIGACGLLAYKNLLVRTDTTLYYLLLIWMLGLGVLHIVLYYKILPWASDFKFWSGLLFTLTIVFIGGIFLLLAFQVGNHRSFVLIHLSSLLIFLLPYLFYSTFHFYLAYLFLANT